MRPLGSTSVADIVKIQIIYPGQAIENKTIQLQLHHQRPGHPVSHGDSRYSQHRTVARRSAVTMNVLLSPQLPVFPHQHENLHLSQRNLSSIHNMSSRKRKADDDGDENMSPMSSPAVSSRPLIRPSKKFRSNDLIGRPLSLPRLLETLDTNQLRTVLERICERHLDIGQEVVSGAPRPTVDSAMNVLYGYQERLNAAAPYGESSAEYTYDRVRSHIVALIDALSDFTPQFLPPIETQPTKSLEFLDGATRFIHGLPDWQPQTYRHHKDNAYEDISKAWALVVNEAAKRGGGFNLHSDGWDQKLARHNEQSGGRLAPAITAMSNSVGWMGSNENGSSSEQGSILSQLVSGAYGSPVRVGPW